MQPLLVLFPSDFLVCGEINQPFIKAMSFTNGRKQKKSRVVARMKVVKEKVKGGKDDRKMRENMGGGVGGRG